MKLIGSRLYFLPRQFQTFSNGQSWSLAPWQLFVHTVKPSISFLNNSWSQQPTFLCLLNAVSIVFWNNQYQSNYLQLWKNYLREMIMTVSTFASTSDIIVVSWLSRHIILLAKIHDQRILDSWVVFSWSVYMESWFIIQGLWILQAMIIQSLLKCSFWIHIMLQLWRLERKNHCAVISWKIYSMSFIISKILSLKFTRQQGKDLKLKVSTTKKTLQLSSHLRCVWLWSLAQISDRKIYPQQLKWHYPSQINGIQVVLETMFWQNDLQMAQLLNWYVYQLHIQHICHCIMYWYFLGVTQDGDGHWGFKTWIMKRHLNRQKTDFAKNLSTVINSFNNTISPLDYSVGVDHFNNSWLTHG